MSARLMAIEAFPGEHLAAEINRLHEQAEQHANWAVVYAARCGEQLLKAKAAVEHGQWLNWLEAHCRVKKSQAAKYMKLAQAMPELLTSNFHPSGNLLGINQAVALLSADEDVKAEVQARIDAGETVTVSAIEALKREAQAEREAREQLAAELGHLRRMNQALNLNLEAASEREQRSYRELLETREQIGRLADEKSQAALEQAQQEAQAAGQRVDELRQELAHRERQKAYAIREGIQHGLAQRQAEVDALNRAIQQAEAELTDYRQRLKERTGAEHENQRLHIDAEKALRELMVLGTTLNMFECALIYPVNWELLDRLTRVAEAIIPRIEQFKADHRQAEKPVPAQA